jgi:hypothetical protein
MISFWVKIGNILSENKGESSNLSGKKVKV